MPVAHVFFLSELSVVVSMGYEKLKLHVFSENFFKTFVQLVPVHVSNYTSLFFISCSLQFCIPAPICSDCLALCRWFCLFNIFQNSISQVIYSEYLQTDIECSCSHSVLCASNLYHRKFSEIFLQTGGKSLFFYCFFL